MEEISRIFLHYFDVHFLQEKVGSGISKAVYEEARLSTRLAILWADEVIIPAASYFESEVCRSIVNEHRYFLGAGVIILAGKADSLGEFLDKKLASYPKNSSQSKKYRAAFKKKGKVPFVTRQSSATLDIRNDWHSILEKNRLGEELNGCGLTINAFLERKWEELPERLGVSAFTPKHALQLLELKDRNRIFDHKISNLINTSYFSSFTKDWEAGIVDELVYLGAGYAVISYSEDIPYRVLLRLLRKYGLLKKVVGVPSPDLIALKQDRKWVEVKKEVIKYSLLRRGYRENLEEIGRASCRERV